MYKVKNRKVIARLAHRSLKAAKQRNIMAICAIVLTSVLFTVLCTMGIGSIDAFQQATMRQSGGSAHASVKYVDDEVFAKLSTHPLVKEISYNRILSDSVDNKELLKRRGELWYKDDTGLKHSFNEPTTGRPPLAENEIIMDTKTMQLLNLPQEIGAKVSLMLTVKGKPVKRDFILSGWWESDPVFNVSILVTSRAYVDAHLDELASTFRADKEMTGSVNPYIMFANTFQMQNKLDRVLTESGYDVVDREAPNFVDSNLNWAYLGAGMGNGDPTTTMALIGGALLILLTGYLIIYNIFQISVLRDIRYYGLLKTIGTTGRQIRRIIRRQAAVLSLIGIPVGLIAGYAVGIRLVPLVLTITIFAGSKVNVSANPFIFIGAALFSTLTVGISTRKPGRIAAGVSPVEAVRYTDTGAGNRKREKASTNGGKLHKMALANLGRNKKRTVLVFLSLSLSLVLLNCVFTLSRGLDIDKYLDKSVDTDFVLAHADYFNFNYSGTESSLGEDTVATVEALPGFAEGGRIYRAGGNFFTFEYTPVGQIFNYGADGYPLTGVYGLDDLPLARLEVFAGEIDVEKLKSGGYILEGIHVDDYGQPLIDGMRYDVGEKVILHNQHPASPESGEREYTTHEYEVMAVVAIKQTNSVRRWTSDCEFYLPANVYLSIVDEKSVMCYAFNIEDEAEPETEVFLKNYTEVEEPLLNYESKAVVLKEFHSMRILILAVGGLLSGIIGLIGILNFTNAMLTGIIARRREFAMMQGIGMTGSQLRRMLCIEGAYYAGGTVIISLVLGVLSSLFVVRNLLGGLWFASYHFVILPMVVCWPAFILIAVLVPAVALAGTVRESLVERLREAE